MKKDQFFRTRKRKFRSIYDLYNSTKPITFIKQYLATPSLDPWILNYPWIMLFMNRSKLIYIYMFITWSWFSSYSVPSFFVAGISNCLFVCFEVEVDCIVYVVLLSKIWNPILFAPKKKKKKKIQPNKDIKSKSKTSPILFGGQAK